MRRPTHQGSSSSSGGGRSGSREAQGGPIIARRQSEYEEVQAMKQAILGRLAVLPMERMEDMASFVEWANAYVGGRAAEKRRREEEEAAASRPDDNEMISILLEFSSKAAAEASSQRDQQHTSTSSGHTSPALSSSSPANSPRKAPQVKSPLASPPHAPSSAADGPPPAPISFCRDPSIDAEAEEQMASAEQQRLTSGSQPHRSSSPRQHSTIHPLLLAAMQQSPVLGAKRGVMECGVSSSSSVVMKRLRKTEEGCRVALTVEQRRMALVVAKVTLYFTYYMEPESQCPRGIRAGRWTYYYGAVSYGSEYMFGRRQVFMGQVIHPPSNSQGHRPVRVIAGVVRFAQDVSRNAALMLDLEQDTFYLVSIASIDAASKIEWLEDPKDLQLIRDKVCKWLSSPLRETESFPHFAPIDQNRAQANSNSRARAGGARPASPPMLPSNTPDLRATAAALTTQRLSTPSTRTTMSLSQPPPSSMSQPAPSSLSYHLSTSAYTARANEPSAFSPSAFYPPHAPVPSMPQMQTDWRFMPNNNHQQHRPQALSALSFLATHSSPLHRYSMPAQPYHIQPPMAPAVPAAYLR